MGGKMTTLLFLVTLFILGIGGLIYKNNLVKKVMALHILNSSMVLFFVYIGSRRGTTAPIMEEGVKKVVDPLPQALMLTAIVIGICLTAFALSLVLRLYEKYRTLDVGEIEKNYE